MSNDHTKTTRRMLLSMLLASPLAFLVPARLKAEPENTRFDPALIIAVAGTMVLTLDEVKRVGPQGLNGLLRAKADNARASLSRHMADEIERRGWGVVEYAENTTLTALNARRDAR